MNVHNLFLKLILLVLLSILPILNGSSKQTERFFMQHLYIDPLLISLIKFSK